jgi:hypothetical protein
MPLLASRKLMKPETKETLVTYFWGIILTLGLIATIVIAVETFFE